MKIVIPRWVLLEIEDWMAHARTGEVGFRFRNGLPVAINRGEVVTPPADVGREIPSCPTCGALLVDPSDFGAKWTCRPCAKTWSIHEIRRLEREVAAKEAGA